MQCCIRWLTLLMILTGGRAATAHFLWLQAEPGSAPVKVNLWFSDTITPGEAKLLDKVAHSQTWVVSANGEKKPLQLEKQVDGDRGSWSASIDAPLPCTVEATCDYGVISRGGETFLLQYSSRCVVGDGGLAQVAGSKLPLDVQAARDGKNLAFTIRFEGKPAANAELLVVLPNNEERELKSDAQGAVRIEAPQSGAYAARAKLQLKTPGERDGKAYDLVRHYSTLTFQLAGAGDLAAADDCCEGPDAATLLKRAREHRAVWENFKGFKADVMVQVDGEMEQGTVEVDDSGAATVVVKNEKLRDWAEEMVGSLVQHRLPAGFDDEHPTFGQEQGAHPLGRKLLLGHKEHQSVYRVRDDMITEVNRRAGPSRFTISVLETELNRDGKYLPRVVSMTTWDAADHVQSNSTVLNTWTQAGNYDVPDRFFEIMTGPGKREVRELKFSNYRLNEEAQAGAALPAGTVGQR